MENPVRPLLSLRPAILASLLIASTSAGNAQANVPTSIRSVANAPAILRRYVVNEPGGSSVSWPAGVVVGNRSTHQLARADLRFTAYDSERTKLSQGLVVSILPELVAPGETAPEYLTVYPFSSAPSDMKLVAQVTCQVVDAQFTGNRHWQSLERWSEPLVRIMSTQS